MYIVINLNFALKLLGRFLVKFPHSPILHYVFSSWIEKTIKKQYIAIGKTDLLYNSMGLCGNFTRFLSEKECLSIVMVDHGKF